MLAAGSYSGAAALLDSRTKELLCLLEGGHAGGITHVRAMAGQAGRPGGAVVFGCVVVVVAGWWCGWGAWSTAAAGPCLARRRGGCTGAVGASPSPGPRPPVFTPCPHPPVDPSKWMPAGRRPSGSAPRPLRFQQNAPGARARPARRSASPPAATTCTPAPARTPPSAAGTCDTARVRRAEPLHPPPPACVLTWSDLAPDRMSQQRLGAGPGQRRAGPGAGAGNAEGCLRVLGGHRVACSKQTSLASTCREGRECRRQHTARSAPATLCHALPSLPSLPRRPSLPPCVPAPPPDRRVHQACCTRCSGTPPPRTSACTLMWSRAGATWRRVGRAAPAALPRCSAACRTPTCCPAACCLLPAAMLACCRAAASAVANLCLAGSRCPVRPADGEEGRGTAVGGSHAAAAPARTPSARRWPGRRGAAV